MVVPSSRRIIPRRPGEYNIMQLYAAQVKEGRIFLHMHPHGVTSWTLDEVIEVGSMNGVRTVEADLCVYGMKSPGTNSWQLSLELQKRCDGAHTHASLTGGKASEVCAAKRRSAKEERCH